MSLDAYETAWQALMADMGRVPRYGAAWLRLLRAIHPLAHDAARAAYRHAQEQESGAAWRLYHRWRGRAEGRHY